MSEPLNPPARADDHIDPPTPEPVLLDEPAADSEPTPPGEAITAPEPAPAPAGAPDQGSSAPATSEPEPAPGTAPEPASPDQAASEPGPVSEPVPADQDPAAPESTPEPPPAEPAPSEVTEPAVDEAAEDDALPDLTGDDALASALEALLLVVDAPANEESLALALGQPVARVTEMLTSMSARYTEDERGIDLRRLGDGWRFVTRDRYAPFVEKLILDGQRAKLTRAALETLAVIAYRQPVTRARVAAVRGVNVDGVIRTLLARGLIEETGTDTETGGLLYRTTELFLERLGLSSLEDLPPIAPLLPEVDSIDDV